MGKITSRVDLVGVPADLARRDGDVARLLDLFGRLEWEMLEAFEANLERLQREESWGLLRAMASRAMEHQAACIVLFANGYIAPSEALCRTVLESSLNLSFASMGNSCERILEYFKTYIRTEREQNSRWLSSVEASHYPVEVKADHFERIAMKERALVKYETFLLEAFASVGVEYSEVMSTWPNVFERFKGAGHEVGYRTVYASLCSQAHNDAEDLLNSFLSKAMMSERYSGMQGRENRFFALMLILSVLESLGEAVWMFVAKYDYLDSRKFQPLLEEILEVAREVAERDPADAD